METRDRPSVTELRRLGATARRRGHPIYENPYLGERADAWREGWQGASSGSRSRLRSGSFIAELYDSLVRDDRDDGLMVREITAGVCEQDSAPVQKGLYRLYRRGLVKRVLPVVTGQRRTPQRYRAVPIPPGGADNSVRLV